MNTSKSTNLPHPWVPSRDTSTVLGRDYPMARSSAVLFDLDGTLIDTTAVYFKMKEIYF
jgi:hypothetical protein